MCTIRTAQLSDAKQLAVLAEGSFRDTFSAQNAEENINHYCASAYSEAIQTREILSPNYLTLVMESDGQFIAYAQLHLDSTPHCVDTKSADEIKKLYVAKDWHGKGVAQQLMSAALEIIEERNTNIVWLGVWEQNSRAIAFYKKFNFKPVGEQTFALGSDLQRDIILVRSIE